MERDERVTVVVPTHDRPGLLPVAVGAALGQAAVDVRVVVVDDGSAVPAADVLPPDPRLEVVRHDRARGVSAARNAGIARVATPWVAFLDDDDVWAPGKLRRQLDALARTGHAWACSSTVSFLGDSLLDVADPPDEDVREAVLHGNIVPGSASGVLASTALVREVGGFDEGIRLEDWDLWIRLAQRSPLAGVRSPDVGYRVHPASRGHDVSDQPAALAVLRAKHAAADPPLAVEPDAWFYEYWARMDYDAGRWGPGLRRTADLLVTHRHLTALRTPVRAALPATVQRRLRAARLARRARRSPGQDVSWLRPHLAR